ncbi:MAG: hypothetical protein HC919_15160, partial [Oscillatoriales cyanobacterium SM2_2_1]|nr:hypothetical protein [Oscillatoriales cyanobacterium SM2_2_1]
MPSLIDRLLGTRQVFELEEQLLHFHALVGLGVCVVAYGFDLYLQLSGAPLLATIVLGILFVFLYIASRFYRLAQRAALIHWGLTTAIVPLLWVVNGGVRGALPLLSLVYVQFFSTVVKVRWVAIAFHAWIVGSCLAIEVWHP